MAGNVEERIKAAEEKLRRLDEEKAKIAAQKRALEQKVKARKAGQRRKVETQVKVLLGAAALKLVQSAPNLLGRLLGQLNERDRQRAEEALCLLGTAAPPPQPRPAVSAAIERPQTSPGAIAEPRSK